MDLLLDTHVFLWWDAASPRLSKAAVDLIGDSANRVFVSAASAWEITIKQMAGRLPLARPVSATIELNGFRDLPITVKDTEAVFRLPPVHQDPFDRILVAQALDRGLVLLTVDGKIKDYPVSVFWAG